MIAVSSLIRERCRRPVDRQGAHCATFTKFYFLGRDTHHAIECCVGATGDSGCCGGVRRKKFCAPAAPTLFIFRVKVYHLWEHHSPF